MKKFILILFITLIALPCYSLTLEGGIKQQEEYARQEVFQDPVYEIDTHPYKMYASSAPSGYRIDYPNGEYDIATGNKSLSYDVNNRLVYIAISDKNVMEYPRKGSRYEYPSGKLIETFYAININNGFKYSPNGDLIGIWENGVLRKKQKVLNKITQITYFN